MSVYKVNLLITSKENRKHFNFLKIDRRRFYTIPEIDNFLEKIMEEVKDYYKKDVNIRFKLIEEVDVEDSKRQSSVELGDFNFTIKPTTKFVNEDYFYQIAETEIYLNSPNVDEGYKEEVLENIKNAKQIKKQNTSEKQGFSKKSLLDKFKLIMPKQNNAVKNDEMNEEKMNEGDPKNAFEEPAVHEDRNSNTITEASTLHSTYEMNNKDENNLPEAKQSEEPAPAVDNNKAQESSIEEPSLDRQQYEKEAISEEKSDEDIPDLLNIPDFQLPKVKAKDVFLKQSDDPVENKRLSFLFDRETRLASFKERRLVAIYNVLVDKYQQYIVANEADIEQKLNEYEESRDAFIEEYIAEIKDQAKKKVENKIGVVNASHNAKLEDFKEEQRKALKHFEEQLEADKEEIINEYKASLQRNIKEEKDKADLLFEDQKLNLRKQLVEKVKSDVYNYLLIDRKEQIQSLNNEIFEYEEETYKSLDEKIKEWQTYFDNQKQRSELQQKQSLDQAKYEVEKEQLEADVLAMKTKDREIEENNQRIKEKELEQKQQEMAFKQEEQRLKAREIEAKEKENQLKMSQKSTFSPKKAGLIAVAGVLLLSLLTLLVSQFFFNSEPTYAELIENKEYIDAYETYPNRYSDLLTAVYEEKDIETLEYLAEEKSDNQASNLYLALASDDTERIIDSYETIENKRILNDELLMSVADHYLLEQDIEGAKQVNQHISNNDYSEKIADTQNYIEIKKDLERVIDESDDESEVNQARRDLEQINTLLKVEEDE